MTTTENDTPWGQADTAKDFGDGVVLYLTPSHGGYHATEELNAQIPGPLRRSGGWYEEDVEWAILAMHFPDSPAFLSLGDDSGERVQKATRIVKQYYPDEYEQITGIRVLAKESRKVARREARARSPEGFEIRTAYGDWDERTPDGMVLAIAERVGDDMRLGFFIPAEEYEPDVFLSPDTNEIAAVDETMRTLRSAGYVVADGETNVQVLARARSDGFFRWGAKETSDPPAPAPGAR